MRPFIAQRQTGWGALVVAALACPLAALAQANAPMPYENQRYGFSLSVPGDLVRVVPTVQDVGGAWESADGQTRLLAVASPNTTGESLMGYRRFVLQRTYQGAVIGYAPVRDSWFVLSGRKDDKMFYERITFTCGGRYIYGWQMTYPIAERARWDRAVEAIHRSYRPGRGEDGRCGQSSRPS